MANWYGASRTNYFKVKDPAAFRAWAEGLGCRVIENEGLYGLLDGEESDGMWPSSRVVDDPDVWEDDEIDFAAELIEHLAIGSVAVLMTVGAEKHRYLTGCATAINSAGEVINLSIGNIYDLAEAKFGTKPTLAEY